MQRAGRSRRLAGGLLALAVVVVAGWLLWPDGSREADLDGKQGSDGQQARESRVVALLEELAAGLGRDATAELASPEGAELLRAIDGNVSSIGFSTLTLRYVAPGELAGESLSPPGTWVADVQVTWQFTTYDALPASLEVPIVIADDGSTARFAGIAAGSDGTRVPLWMLEELEVHKTPRTLVLAADAQSLPTLVELATIAVPTVDRVLPEWKGSLVLEEPSSNARFNLAIGASEDATSQLAGVTTTIDGSVVRGSSTHVLLNPSVFDQLGPRAAQIVVSHEATHVATDGALSAAPQWLTEGFADYVALRDLDVPVTRSASQVLDEVRRNGPPVALPSSGDFGGDNRHLGASYESSWLACRLIAQTYGEDKLLAFYQRADADGAADAAFAEVLGTTEKAFTRVWSAELGRLASAS